MNAPVPVGGRPSPLLLAEVRVVNSDGTVDVRSMSSRASKSHVRVPKGYTPHVGDQVVVGYLAGHSNKPTVLTVLA